MCRPPFIGGALITVHVKLNMGEISRAAGVVGRRDGWEEGGVQSRRGWAVEEPLSPNVLFPAFISLRRRQGIGQIELEGIRVIPETGGGLIVKISTASCILGIINTFDCQ